LQVNTGKVQSLQMPAFSLTLYSKLLTYYSKHKTLADFDTPQKLAIFLVAASIGFGYCRSDELDTFGVGILGDRGRGGRSGLLLSF